MHIGSYCRRSPGHPSDCSPCTASPPPLRAALTTTRTCWPSRQCPPSTPPSATSTSSTAPPPRSCCPCAARWGVLLPVVTPGRSACPYVQAQRGDQRARGRPAIRTPPCCCSLRSARWAAFGWPVYEAPAVRGTSWAAAQPSGPPCGCSLRAAGREGEGGPIAQVGDWGSCSAGHNPPTTGRMWAGRGPAWCCSLPSLKPRRRWPFTWT